MVEVPQQVSVSYRFIEDETDKVIAVAKLVDGFFAESVTVPRSHVHVIGSFNVPIEYGKPIADVRMQVVDLGGAVIGSYYLGDVVALEDNIAGRAGFLLAVNSTGCPYPYAGSIWPRWASTVPIRRGEWAEWPAAAHESWMHVVQQVWFAKGRGVGNYGERSTWVLDGSLVLNESSFYCAIGEAVNGAGGYFGSSMSGFADCLRHTAGADSVSVMWHSFSTSRKRVGEEVAQELVDILEEFGVRVQFPAEP